MTNLKRLTLATLFALSAISLLAGCGDPNGTVEQTPSCSIAKDCKDGELCTNLNGDNKGFCEKKCTPGQANACDTGMTCTTFYKIDSNTKKKIEVGSACLKSCTKDKECGEGKICGVTDSKQKVKSCLVQVCKKATDNCGPNRQCNTTTKLCEGKDTTQNPGQTTGCETAASCGSGPIWLCDKSGGKPKGVCKSRPVASIVIKDKGADCSNKKDTGADIVGIAFLSPDGTVASWANTPTPVVENGKEAGPGYNNPASPDGQPADYDPNDAKHCATDKLKGGISKFTSIGCDGYLAMAVPSPLEETKVAVFEFDGKVCGNTPASEPDDKYAVYACITPIGSFPASDYNAVSSFLTTNCVEITADASGYSESAYPPASTQN